MRVPVRRITVWPERADEAVGVVPEQSLPKEDVEPREPFEEAVFGRRRERLGGSGVSFVSRAPRSARESFAGATNRLSVGTLWLM
jgi:hypothetical protein